MPTAIWNSPLRSGSAHWDLEFAVEARQCPLRSGSRGWDLDCEEEEADCDLEVAVGIWTARRRRRRRWRRRMRRRRRRTALIKSNNPHLAGGEQYGIVNNDDKSNQININHQNWCYSICKQTHISHSFFRQPMARPQRCGVR